MPKQGIKIEQRDGVVHFTGQMDEYTDLDQLLSAPAPIVLNLKAVRRINSIGIRNMLKFLSKWGGKGLVYQECPSDFIDQINMIPALLGVAGQGQVASLFVPYECDNCDHKEEKLRDIEGVSSELMDSGTLPPVACSNCKSEMFVFSDSFFVFLQR